MSASKDTALARRPGTPNGSDEGPGGSGRADAKDAAARHRPRRGGTLAAHGEPLQWLTGGALVIALAMVAGLLALIVIRGTSTFWPVPLERLETHDGRVVLGEYSDAEDFPLTRDLYAALPAAVRSAPGAPFAGKSADELDEHAVATAHRTRYRTGNFDLTDSHYTWVSDFEVASTSQPEWALVVERLRNGRFYGEPRAFVELEPFERRDLSLAELREQRPAERVLVTRDRGRSQLLLALGEVQDGDEILSHVVTAAEGPEAAWARFEVVHPHALELLAERKHLEKIEIGRLNAEQDSARLAVVQARLDHGEGSPEQRAAQSAYERLKVEQGARLVEIEGRIAEIEQEHARFALLLATSQNELKALAPSEITIAYPANRLSFFGRLGVWLERGWEFLSDDPREANTEGGVLPAIFGTVVMTLLMCIAVVPFGVLAALYLREYAKRGPVVTAVRIAVNNLAGVPSIVYGAFGFGFFCYGFGKYVDGGPRRGLGIAPWSSTNWTLAAMGLLLLVAFAVIAGARSASSRARGPKASMRWLARAAAAAWIGAAAIAVMLLLYTPFFDGFFEARLEEGQPTFGTSGLLWASLTLALLTLPVVIVSTEEALAAVPGSMREGSYACGASKWQTMRRIVLPRALPGILTGAILAMARGAGEVAPLMLVGVVKLSQKLAVDGIFPYVHPERSFMHLGFNIYDVGFKSQNSEAGKPIVFTTTLLLVLIIAVLNVFAVWLRGRLRRRFVDGAF